MNAETVESRIAFYQKDIDNPFSVNGFRGTWQFSEHNKIPDVLSGFLLRYFGVGRIKRIPIAQINELMNEIWDGPGSLEKIFRAELEMEQTGKTIKFDPRDYPKSKKDEEDEEDKYLTIPDLPINSFDSQDEFDDED